MATEDAKRFLDNISNDPSMRAQFRANAAQNVDTALDFAFTHGYVFTESELRAALSDYPDQPVIDELRSKFKIARTDRPAQTS
ncbi:MAG TPA: Nif11-like leader peptide family natural product precursor [Aggregatilineales bacterium]|nr:Nif11-like leader peptide family natural product precursor [Aggregatilineales bacterium]